MQNIEGAECVIAFVSPSYIESYACFFEMLMAVANDVEIIFVEPEKFRGHDSKNTAVLNNIEPIILEILEVQNKLLSEKESKKI